MTNTVVYGHFGPYGDAGAPESERIKAHFQHTASGQSFYTESEVWREISDLADTMCGGMECLFWQEDQKERGATLRVVEKAGVDIQQYLLAARDLQIFAKQNNPKVVFAGPDLTGVQIADLDCEKVSRMIDQFKQTKPVGKAPAAVAHSPA